MVGRFAGAFLSSLRGLKLAPAKWRFLVPPTSTPKGQVQHLNPDIISKNAGFINVISIVGGTQS